MLIFLLVACERRQNSISVNYENVSSSRALLSIIERIDLVPLQTMGAPLLGSHTELFLLGDSFIVLDSENSIILRYSRDGRFLNTVGIRGNGPGEYINICNIQVIGEDIIVFSTPDKILHYGLMGDFRSEEHMDGLGTQSWLVPEGLLTYYSFGSGRGHRVGLWENENETPFLKDESKVIHFSAGAPVFSEWEGRVFFIDAYNPSIMVYTEKKVSPQMEFDFGDAAIPQKFYEFDNSFAAMEFLLARRFALIQRYFTNGRYQFLEVFIQNQNKMDARYGIAQKGIWKWFSVGEIGGSPLAGSFRTMDNHALYCLLDPSSLGKMDRSFKPFITNPEVIESISSDDNPVLAIISLK